MELKSYQSRVLECLANYYRRVRALTAAGDSFPASMAFTSVTAELHNGMGLPYAPVQQLPGIPYVCLRVPTGGGKTLIACEAVAVAKNELLYRDTLLVLWLVPSDAIRTQTLARMAKGEDYRIALESKLGPVEVMDIEQALSIQRSVLDGATVVVVSTMQAFRRKSTADLNVYKNNGALMHHFENLPREVLETLEKDEAGTYPKSLANVFRLRRPFVIVDEAHNNRQPLAFETLRRLAPSGILELTATPNLKAETVTYEGEKIENPPSNVLVSISAYALKAEAMIKMPIYLRHRVPWDELLGDAIGCLNRLQHAADVEKGKTGEYIRPIMLLQAQPKSGERATITVAEVKEQLLRFDIPEEQIAIATGEIRELDDVADIKSPDCRIRFVITVQALKEGWDCPFAYVLFSVAELTSGRPVEQILGRVLRLPNARRKINEELNTAYAFVASSNFDAAARALADGLIAAGFEKQDVAALIQRQPELPTPSGGGLSVVNESFTPVSVVLKKAPAAIPLALVDAVDFDSRKKTLTISRPLTVKEQTELYHAVDDEESKQIIQAAYAQLIRTPSERGETFAVPQLELELEDGSRHVLTEDDISERSEWSLDTAAAALDNFVVSTDPRDLRIDIAESERVTSTFISDVDRQRDFLGVPAEWNAGVMAAWILRQYPQRAFDIGEYGRFVLNAIQWLTRERGFSLGILTANRYRLAEAVNERIGDICSKAKEVALEQMILPGIPKTPRPSCSQHVFTPDNYPIHARYTGLKIPRHFYPEINEMNSEEVEVARLLGNNENVDFWVRNVEREPDASFWLQTATDKFYPDFVCKLANGKILAIEYKGGHLATGADTAMKEKLGQLWAKQTGMGFLMIREPRDLGRIPEMIRRMSAE